jgi:two-component system cell cycle response regulator DivK
VKGVKVLVVEDNVVNQKLARTLLALAGFEVQVADGGAAALEMLAAFHPRVILTDIQMPGMDGLELTRIIKGREDLRDVRVVALTAYAMRGDKDRFLAAGCDGYIPKPIDVKTFAQTVADYAGG